MTLVVLVLLISWQLGTRLTRQQTSPDALSNQTTQAKKPRLAEKHQPVRLAVLYFENQTRGHQNLDGLAKGLCSMMITRLDAQSTYQIVERQRLEAVIKELNLTQSQMFDQTQIARMGKLMGARQLVLGSYFYLLDVFRIDVRLIDVETGVTLVAAGVEGKPEDFSHLVNQLVDQLLQNDQAHARLGKHGAVNGKDSRISVQLVLELGEALDAYDRGEVASALNMIERAIRSHPSFLEALRLRDQLSSYSVE